MTCREYGRAALAAAAAWVWVAAAHSATDTPVDFDIPAQPMASALNTWAVQANAQVFVDPAPVAHLTAPAVRGSLAPRQALRALLAHSNLQVIQGADGVLVIRPRPAIAATRKRQVPAPMPEAAAPVAASIPVAPTALQNEGPWLLRLDAEYLKGDGSASGGATAAAGAEYFITDQVAAAISVTAPRTQSFAVPGSLTAPANRASARLQMSQLTLKYYLAPQNRLRPYVGAGIDVATLYGANGVTGLDRVTVGPTVQAGLDVRLNPHWMLNADVSWAQVRPDQAASPGGNIEREIRIDPVRFGLGFVYRFGAAGPVH